MAFPATELRPSVQLFLNGQWVEFADAYGVGDDVYIDEYIDMYEGRETRIGGRLEAQTIEVVTGLQEEFSETPPGRVSFVLGNRDGHVTPRDPRSPYWPDLKRGALCRVQLPDSGGEWVPRFYGKVTELRPTFPEGGTVDVEGLTESYVTVTASGVLQDLAQRSSAQSPLYRSVVRDSTVKDYWPCEQGVYGDAAQSALPGSMPSLRTEGAVRFGVDSTAIPGASSMAEVAASETGLWEARLSNDNASAWTVGVMFQCPTPPDTTGQFIRVLEVLTSGNPYRYVVDLDNPLGTPRLYYQLYYLDGSIADDSADLDPTGIFGTTDAVLLELNASQSGGNVQHDLRWRGILGNVAFGLGTVPVAGTVGRPWHVRGTSINTPQGGFRFGQIMSRTGIATNAHINAARGWLGEGPRRRIERVCQEEDVPFTWEVPADLFVPGSKRVGVQKSAPVLDLMRESAASDQGLLTEVLDGPGLNLKMRVARYHQDVALTLDAAQSEIANPFEPVDDDQGYTNQVTARRIDGGAFTWPHDAPSPLAHVEKPATLHVDTMTRDLAGWTLHLGSHEAVRVAQLTVDLAVVDGSFVDEWLAVQPGDRVQVVNLPDQWPTGELDLIVLGWTETFSATSWTVTANCAPYGPWLTAIVEDDVYGRVDTDGTTLGEPVDDNDTSFDVDNVLLGWTDADGDYDIYVGGEVMTVTAVTGDGTVPGSTQTFTVTRGVNGIAKAHAAGAVVELAHPAVLAR